MNDAQIKQGVEAELAWEPSVRAPGIGVAVQDGIVVLSGHVLSYQEKWAAERAAARVSGVAAVTSELEVRLPGSSERGDEEIARSAINSLNWNTSVPAGRIRVQVSKGWMTLEGTVDWQFQKKAAARAVRSLIGVRGVSDLVSVKPAVSPGVVSAAIEAALTCSAVSGEVFLASDGVNLSTPELIRAVGTALARRVRLMHVPIAVLRLGARVGDVIVKLREWPFTSESCERLLGSLIIDSSKLRTCCGYRPPFTVAQGLDRTAAWFLAANQVPHS